MAENNITDSIDFSKLSKQVEDKKIDENMLSSTHPKRIIIDISTDNFIKIIFKEDLQYYLFLNYVNLLDLYLNYYPNLDLVSSLKLPYCDSENIELFFKGGNVMNYHYSQMVTDPRIQEIFSAFFKKSDFDFSVNVGTKNDSRFNELKKYIYPQILKFLSKTTDLFNNYLESVLNHTLSDKYDTIDDILINFRNESDEHIFNKMITTIKKIICKPRFYLLREIINKYVSIYGMNHIPNITNIGILGSYVQIIFNDNNKIQYISNYPESYNLKYDKYIVDNYNELINLYNTQIVSDLENVYKYLYSNSKYYACVLYPYYRYLIFPIGSHELEFAEMLDRLHKYNFDLIKNNNFYTVDKINEMKAQIKKSILELNDVYYEIDTEKSASFF